MSFLAKLRSSMQRPRNIRTSTAALEFRRAISDVVETFSDGMLIGSVATAFSCKEVEILAHLYRVLGDWETADRWIENHGEDDDCDDMHCRCSKPDCVVVAA